MADTARTRVLIFSLAYYPDMVGGAEVAVKEITDRIGAPAGDLEFHMVTLRGSRRLPRVEKVGNVTVHRVGVTTAPGLLFDFEKILFPIIASLKASRLHAATPFDATWGIMAGHAGGAALFFKMFHMRVPFVLTLQEGISLQRIRANALPILPLFRRIFTYADRVTAISGFLASFGEGMGALNVSVVPNGVDVAAFSRPQDPDAVARLKDSLGIVAGDRVVITASRLVKKNAIGDVVEALRHLPQEVKFVVLGTGELEAELRARAKRLGLDGRVIFKGFVPHAELPLYLAASDVFVRPSLSEGFGNSFIEAMAARVPVVATPVGGIVDFLHDKETGLFCEVSNPEDVARKVNVLLQDKALRDEIVDRAQKMVAERYDWARVAREMREKGFGMI